MGADNNNARGQAVIVDLENRDLPDSMKNAFLRAGIIPLIKQARKIYVHVPLGATLFQEGKPVGGTSLDVDLAEALVLASEGKPVVFYEAPATAHRDIKGLFEKLGYTALIEKYPQVRLLDLTEYADPATRCVSLHFGFDYPPLQLPNFLFDKENLIISFSNPKAPFSEIVAGFRGLPFSLSGKALVMGSTLFQKKNVLHLAFSDINLGLKDYVIAGLQKMLEAGVQWVGINGGRFAGAMIDQVKVHPVDWNLLVISRNIAIADAITAALMGFQPLEIGYFKQMVDLGLLPSEMTNIVVDEIGHGRERLLRQLATTNPFLPAGTPITTRQWIFGLMHQFPLKGKLRVISRVVPSIIRYKFGRKLKRDKTTEESTQETPKSS